MLAEYSSGNGPVRMKTFSDPRSVVERWYKALALEFADTVLIEAAIVDNPLVRPSKPPREPLRVTAAGRARNGGANGRH
jgi:hypothetical protein